MDVMENLEILWETKHTLHALALQQYYCTFCVRDGRRNFMTQVLKKDGEKYIYGAGDEERSFKQDNNASCTIMHAYFDGKFIRGTLRKHDFVRCTLYSLN